MGLSAYKEVREKRVGNIYNVTIECVKGWDGEYGAVKYRREIALLSDNSIAYYDANFDYQFDTRGVDSLIGNILYQVDADGFFEQSYLASGFNMAFKTSRGCPFRVEEKMTCSKGEGWDDVSPFEFSASNGESGKFRFEDAEREIGKFLRFAITKYLPLTASGEEGDKVYVSENDAFMGKADLERKMKRLSARTA